MADRIWQLRANMTAYDAGYVALAKQLTASLLTCAANTRGYPACAARSSYLANCVGEDGLVAPGGEQLALPGGRFGVEVPDAADDQPDGNCLPLAGGESGVFRLGDLGVKDPAPQLVTPDGAGIADRRRGLISTFTIGSRHLDIRIAISRGRRGDRAEEELAGRAAGRGGCACGGCRLLPGPAARP